jgi:hypothetical protein
VGRTIYGVETDFQQFLCANKLYYRGRSEQKVLFGLANRSDGLKADEAA